MSIRSPEGKVVLMPGLGDSLMMLPHEQPLSYVQRSLFASHVQTSRLLAVIGQDRARESPQLGLRTSAKRQRECVSRCVSKTCRIGPFDDTGCRPMAVATC